MPTVSSEWEACIISNACNEIMAQPRWPPIHCFVGKTHSLPLHNVGPMPPVGTIWEICINHGINEVAKYLRTAWDEIQRERPRSRSFRYKTYQHLEIRLVIASTKVIAESTDWKAIHYSGAEYLLPYPSLETLAQMLISQKDWSALANIVQCKDLTWEWAYRNGLRFGTPVEGEDSDEDMWKMIVRDKERRKAQGVALAAGDVRGFGGSGSSSPTSPPGHHYHAPPRKPSYAPLASYEAPPDEEDGSTLRRLEYFSRLSSKMQEEGRRSSEREPRERSREPRHKQEWEYVENSPPSHSRPGEGKRISVQSLLVDNDEYYERSPVGRYR